jgi:hypothetical protein
MDLMEVARQHAARQGRISAASMLAAIREWRRLDHRDLSGSWRTVGPRLTGIVTAGQLASAEGANSYVSTAVRAQGDQPQPDGVLSAAAFAGWAADGRPLDSLMLHSLVTTKRAISGGMSVTDALSVGENLLATVVSTEVADAGRGADQVRMFSDRRVSYYVRVLGGRGCSRCAVLAGKHFAVNTGFLRHPKCQCRHVPVSNLALVKPQMLDAEKYFNSLSAADQNRRFTVAGARAIRDGADITSVVNARRGMGTVEAYGRRVRATNEGITRRGSFYRSERRRAIAAGLVPRSGRGFRLMTPRLLPEEIYKLAGTREEALDMLRRFGYLH